MCTGISARMIRSTQPPHSLARSTRLRNGEGGCLSATLVSHIGVGERSRHCADWDLGRRLRKSSWMRFSTEVDATASLEHVLHLALRAAPIRGCSPRYTPPQNPRSRVADVLSIYEAARAGRRIGVRGVKPCHSRVRSAGRDCSSEVMSPRPFVTGPTNWARGPRSGVA